MSENPQEKKETRQLLTSNDEYCLEPFILFDYSIRSQQTKNSYFRRLRTFFNYSNVIGTNFREKCNNFVNIGRQHPNQALKLILDFLQFQKQRVELKEITGGTLKIIKKR